MSILIGHASIDERGRANGGQAGDQTGAEVCVRSWYAAGWNVVLRPKSAAVAEKMASACETLCKGNLVGYDQYQRNTLWDELERAGWNPDALKTKCETDCSAFMTACARAAGISVPRVTLTTGQLNAPVTQTMRSAFGSTGAFEILTESKYLTSDKYLRRGDVLVRESGHTAMALDDGESAWATGAEAAVTKLTRLGVINSPDYWLPVIRAGQVKYLDLLFEKAAAKITKAGPRASSPINGVGSLVVAGVIDTPDYWLATYPTVQNLGELLCALGGAVK